MTDKTQIAAILVSGEGETVEFKEQWNETALQTLAAFANHNGGMLLLGVADTGKIITWQGTDKDLTKIANQITDRLHIQPSLNKKIVDGIQIVIIQVAKSAIPVSCNGKYFIRVGSTTREISPSELGHFFIRKLGISWDSITEDYSVDEIDGQTISEFITKAQSRLPYLNTGEMVTSLLEKLELVRSGKITRAAILLFGKNPQHYFLNSQIHIGRFKGTTTIIDDKLLRGSIFNLIRQTIQQLQQYQHVRLDIIKEAGKAEDEADPFRRKETWDYPLPALREALLNALIHRDYFITSSEIQIRVYDDKLTISSPGELPGGITLADLSQPGHRSVLRNPLLAQILYYAGYIERWGTGTTRIIEACLQNNIPVPRFSSQNGWFEVSFSKKLLDKEALYRAGLKERQLQALEYLEKEGRINSNIYQEITHLSRAAAARDLVELIEKGIVTKIGTTGRNIYYVLSQARVTSMDKRNVSETSQKRLKRLKKGS